MDGVDIAARFLTVENLGVAGAIGLLVELARRVLPGVFASPRFNRILPLLPEGLGLLAYGFIPALSAPGATLGERLVTGILVGMASSKAYKIVRQSFLGHDRQIAEAKKTKPKKPLFPDTPPKE